MDNPAYNYQSVPCELIMRRKQRSYLDLVQPSVRARVLLKEFKQKGRHDQDVMPKDLNLVSCMSMQRLPRGKLFPG